MNEAGFDVLVALLIRYATVLSGSFLEGLAIVKCELDSGRVVWGVQFRFKDAEHWLYLSKSGNAWLRASVGAFEEILGVRAGVYFASATKGLRKGVENRFVDTDGLDQFVRCACSLLEENGLQRLYLIRVEDEQGGKPLDGWSFCVRRLTGDRNQFPSLFRGVTDYRAGIVSFAEKQKPSVMLNDWYKGTGTTYKALLKSTGRDHDTGMSAPRHSPHPLKARLTGMTAGAESYRHC